jgi:hypothetical protein
MMVPRFAGAVPRLGEAVWTPRDAIEGEHAEVVGQMHFIKRCAG